MKTSGAVAPSSRFLVDKMLNEINFSKAELIVELGPGNGKITKKILSKLNSKAMLICFEINNHFYQELQKINHPQLIVLNKSAEAVKEELEKLGYIKSCHIISSLPLANIPKTISDNILQKSYASLSEEGTFIQYQYSLTYFKKLKKVFNQSISLDFEMLNLPPAFIYRCKKVV